MTKCSIIAGQTDIKMPNYYTEISLSVCTPIPSLVMITWATSYNAIIQITFHMISVLIANL